MCQGPVALLDLKHTRRVRPPPGELLERGRFANNRTHVRHYRAEALSQAGWGLGPTLGVCTRSRIYGFHMCCVFLYLFRLGAGWRCEAPGRAPGGCRGGGALEAAAKA